MDSLREDLNRFSARLEELETSQKMSLHEIDGLKRGVTALRNNAAQAHQATSEMRGVFASVEKHMIKLFESDQTLKSQVADLTLRVESLEKKAS